jgi:hypothetical protein
LQIFCEKKCLSSQIDCETLRIIQEQYDKDAKKANIPVPPILTIDDYDKHVPRDYVRPQSYVRFKRKYSRKVVLFV